jgi:uncharacterized membrane protein YraQ (UPF0718 family)
LSEGSAVRASLPALERWVGIRPAEIWWLPAAGLVVALAGLGVALEAGPASQFVAVFMGIFLEAFPFLLLGVLLSTVIEALVPAERVQWLLPGGRLTAPAFGSLLGLVFPVCECGVIPVGRRLLLTDLPLPLVLAFILAGPAVNPVVIASTWVAFNGDPLIVFGRIGLTLLVAIVVALVAGFYPGWPLLDPEPPRADDEVALGHQVRPCRIDWPAHCARAVDELLDLGRYLVLGAALAAAVQTFVPRGAILALAHDGVTSVAIMMGLAALLSICSTVDAFVALPFAQTFGPGALLGFLVLGPMVDVKNALLLGGVFRRRLAIVTIGLATQLVFLAAVMLRLNVG